MHAHWHRHLLQAAIRCFIAFNANSGSILLSFDSTVTPAKQFDCSIIAIKILSEGYWMLSRLDNYRHRKDVSAENSALDYVITRWWHANTLLACNMHDKQLQQTVTWIAQIPQTRSLPRAWKEMARQKTHGAFKKFFLRFPRWVQTAIDIELLEGSVWVTDAFRNDVWPLI